MVLTPQERRGVVVIVGLLLLGTAYDAWRAVRPSWTPPPEADRSVAVPQPPAGASEASGTPPQSGAPEDANAMHRGSDDGRFAAARDAASGPGLATAPLAPASIDLNAADAATLDRLPGVGPVLAGRIVAHRRDHGPFEHIDDLRAVRGIGPRMLERLRPWVRVSAPPPGR